MPSTKDFYKKLNQKVNRWKTTSQILILSKLAETINSMNRFVSSFFGFSVLFTPALSSAEAVRIETSFDPPNITLANTSTYKIVVHGSQQGPAGGLPQIDGLKFSNPPQTFRVSFVYQWCSIRSI